MTVEEGVLRLEVFGSEGQQEVKLLLGVVLERDIQSQRSNAPSQSTDHVNSANAPKTLKTVPDRPQCSLLDALFTRSGAVEVLGRS